MTERPDLDKYDRMLRLADLFDSSGQEMRARSKLGAEILRDEAVADSSELSKATYDVAAEDIRSATTGTHGLLTRSIELDADALVVRATVLTYRWIDELQELAYQTLGSIAGRAIGYLAPSVALGGAIVSAGLIETDALERDGIADYLNELAEANPELMDHVTSGGGGLVEALQLRSLLTSSLLAGDRGRMAAAGGLRAIGVEPFAGITTAAVRDVAGPVVAAGPEAAEAAVIPGSPSAPRSLEELLTNLSQTAKVTVHRVGETRFIAYLPGPDGPTHGRRLRLVGGDPSSYAARAVAAIEAAVGDTDGATVMLVGSASGGVAAAEIAAEARSASFTVDQVVTAGAPSAQVPTLPEGTRMLSLEDRADPVALLGSLISAGATNRLVVVFDAGQPDGGGEAPAYVLGGRAADRADNEDLRAEITRIQGLGYLAG
ncbi:hypothetical protein ISU07_04170 [Nocardioides islandensis]|uniref:Alpha/beta hydrolase n=1 Tax=Nocardioides islandensis TaxID=433663 RepID=A0A930YD29_9ACTN|nr:hypothetical protein [Nocardioides islandensis]MBF4762312.1 hypothetical protein [Nocardioides islandensis]